MLIRLELSTQIFEKYLNKKFNANPSGGSRVVPYGSKNRQTDRKEEQIFVFRSFANAPETSSPLRCVSMYDCSYPTAAVNLSLP